MKNKAVINPLAEIVGKNIVAAAQDLGWTFPQLAKDMDVREETLQRWLTGERMITVFGLVRASRVLGVSMEALTKGLL
jgi:plasmid maintenance system antidote protein VapI